MQNAVKIVLQHVQAVLHAEALTCGHKACEDAGFFFMMFFLPSD